MITHGERGTGQASEMGWSPWGAGWVDGERPVLVGGEARSSKSKLYAKLERESQRYSPEVVAGRFYNGASLAATAVMRCRFPLRFDERLIVSITPQGKGAPSMPNLDPVPSTYAMWRAYTIAPSVTPMTFMAIVPLVGVTLPANAIALGFFVCYLVAGLIGMPIAFSLRRMNSLNAWTIHGAALTWGLLWSLFCSVVTIYVVLAIDGSIESLPLTIGWFLALMVPPVVLAGTAFWLLVRNPKLI